MIVKLNIFDNTILIDTTVNNRWNIKDEVTNLSYRISNSGEEVSIQIVIEETRLYRASSNPSGRTCPTCQGSGRL